VIERFLPKQMSEEEVKEVLRGIIQELGVTDASGLGKVMGSATKHLAGKADGKMISALVKQLLS
ncbi:MAG: GatB/YqeY domain-containing protein, partial [Bacteroidota bacterium]